MRCLFLAGLSSIERSELDGFDSECRELYAELTATPNLHRDELAARIANLDPAFELRAHGSGTGAAPFIELSVSDPAAKPRLRRFASLAPESLRIHAEPGPRPLDEVTTTVQNSTGRSLEGARVRAGFARGHLLDLVVHLSEASDRDDQDALAAAEGAVYGLLGEKKADDWIGRIDVAPLPRGGPLKLVGGGSDLARTFPLSLLEATVDNAIAGLYEGMRAGALESGDDEWTLLEAGPSEPVSFPAQHDLLYAGTLLPEMLKCFLEEAPFSSCRFSERGEHFAYLKYRQTGQAEARALERQALEDAIEHRLVGDRLGRVVGNGLGTDHAYIDMALADVPRAIHALRELGQGRDLPKASWLLFCDSEWRREWVGIWSDSPAPRAG